MGLDIDYFYALTPREFANISKGYAKKTQGQTRLSWEQTRSIMYMVNLSIPSKRKKESITKFLPFSWEKEEAEVKELSKKEQKDLFEKWDTVKFNK